MMRFSRTFIAICLTLAGSSHAEVEDGPVEKMLQAIEKGDRAAVEKLLQEGFDPNTSPGEENSYPSFLMMAIDENQLAITEALLEGKADPAFESRDRRIAMMDAAKANRIPHAKLLIKHGVSIDSMNSEGTTPLMQLAIYDEGPDTQAILDLGATVDLVTDKGETALMRAAQHANSAVVSALLKAGADPNLANALGETVLMLALEGENPLRRDTETAARVVKMLIDAGADINKTDPEGRTALMLAVNGWQVKEETIEVLLTANPKVDIKDKDGRDALMLAVAHENREIHIARLIELGADIGITDSQGTNLLMLAAKRTRLALVTELLGKGLSPKATTAEGWTAVHEVCAAYPPQNDYFGNKDDTPATFGARVLEILKVLHQNGADLTAVGDHKLTPFHLAAHRGNPGAVSYLLPHYPDVDIATEDGSTALHLAAANNSVEVIELLLPRTKVIDPSDGQGLTPLAYAADRGSAEAVVRLKTAGADIDAEDKQGIAPLERAVVEDDTAIIKLLLEQGADPKKLKDPRERLLAAVRRFHDRALSGEDYALRVELFAGLSDDINARDADGMTVLMWASASGNPEALQPILARGPDLEARSGDGRTAMMWAASSRATDTMEALKAAGADVSARDPNGKTAADWLAWSEIEDVPGDEIISGANDGLWEKIREGRKEELATYLAKGSWDAKDRIGGEAPLHLAAGFGDTAALEVLLDRGATVDQGLDDKRTPLMDAAAMGQIGAMKLLLQRGADPIRRDRSELRAIDLAVLFRHGEAVRLLLDQAEPLGAEETELLARVVMIGDGDLLRQLFRKGAKIRHFDPDAREPEWSPTREVPAGGVLNAAARRADPAMLRVLVEFPEASGAAHPALLAEAMHHAAESGRLENVRYLVEERKVDIDSLLEDSLGGTITVLSSERQEGKETRFSAISRAIEQGHGELLRYLVERGAKIQGRTRGGEPPLSFAVIRGDAELVRYLLDHKAATEIPDFDGKTALHHAAEKNRAELVKLLLEKGAKRDAKDDRGKTPADRAEEAKAVEAGKALKGD